jgi:hypothetical protein
MGFAYNTWGTSWATSWGTSWGGGTPPAPVDTGGGASAKRRGRLRGEGWGREREMLEASLARIEQGDVQRIARTMADSDRPQAQRIARKLIDYRGELAEAESLRRELAKLELAQRERLTNEQRETDLAQAAQELRSILREDAEVEEIVRLIEDSERRLVLGLLGYTIH